MWKVGFKTYLKEVLDKFQGKIEYGELTLEKVGGDQVKITLDNKNEVMSYEGLYDLLIPDDKLDYLYLFQDVLEELSGPQSILNEIKPIFEERKEQMNTESAEEMLPSFDFVTKRIVCGGVEYEQLAFL